MVYGGSVGESADSIVSKIISQPNTHPLIVGIGLRQFDSVDEAIGARALVEKQLAGQSYFRGTSMFSLNLMNPALT